MKIGKYYEEHGGIYAGMLRGEPGCLDYHIFHAGAEHEIISADWKTACEKAKLPVNGFTDWSLPDRSEARLLSINSPDSFDQSEWYWTSTQDAGSSDYAWLQDFSDVSQENDHKLTEYRARAVRKVYIGVEE